MLTIVDLQLSNIASVSRALDVLKVKHETSSTLEAIERADKLILPGVGNFFEASYRLKEHGLRDVIRKKVLEDKTPILGICLGMQLLATYGEEGGGSEGLDLIKGRVESLRKNSGFNLRLPHIGWNEVKYDNFPLFGSVKQPPCFYFVHTYGFNPEENITTATTDYGIDFIAAVQKGHIFGVQFHPEKSQESGIQLLKNFCEDKC